MQHFVRKCNKRFLADARPQEAQLRLIRLPERIAKLVRMRLELTSDFIGAHVWATVGFLHVC